MSKREATLRIDQAVWDATSAEALRRGLSDPSEIVEEALRRYVASEDLGRLMGEFRQRDAQLADPLTDEDAACIVAEELAAWRNSRTA